MAPIELDAPEFEALVEIRQKLTPLISKRIACSRNQETSPPSLAVLNARDAMSFELDQVFLHLRKDQDMGLEDYKQFLGDLQELRLLLEGFIDEQVLTGSNTAELQVEGQTFSSTDQESETSDSNEFPKLKALIRRATDNLDGSDLSYLINLPDTKEESQKAEQIATRFVTNSSKRAQKDTDSQEKEGQDGWCEPKPGLAADDTSMPMSYEPLQSLVTTLRENIEAKCCEHQHVAKVQVREPTWSAETPKGLDHNLFLSCSSVDGKWQQTTPPVERPLKLMKHACKTIRDCLDDEETLAVFLHRDGLLWNPDSSRIIQCPPVWPTLSLAEILRSDLDPLKPYDKVILALNLGRTLLRMYGMGMDGCAWSVEDLFFLFEPSQQTAYEIYNPYLNYSLTGTGKPLGPTSSRKFPVLIAFAKLLMEIACGKILGPFERRPDISLLAELQKGTVTEEVVAAYVYAIKKCLKANKDDDEDVEIDEQCRTVIRDVVRDLEMAWSSAYATKSDPNKPKTLKVPRDVLERQAPSRQSGSAKSGLADVWQEQLPPAVSTETTSPSNSLFDMTRIKMLGGYMDSRCTWARDFLDRAYDFYTQHISHLPSEKRIKVAVLDTGIDDTNIFFRAARRNRRKRDSAIKLQRSFLAGVSASDTDGHGTNVAALVLKMTPEADLYVGKISSGHEVDGTDHIIEAIRWAIGLDVHIINMSFGMSSPNEAIRGAIRAAESAGIICTVAASNYGGNETRSFPAKMDQVLCIHAGDGNGNKSGLNPTPLDWRDNISTLGVCIPSEWEGEEGQYVSGTSYAAPVAAGIAANVLRFVQYATDQGLMTQPQRMSAFSCSGMRHMLLAMRERRDGYDFVMPWRRMWSDGSTELDVVSKVKEALKNV
ncbi:hypothetical protein ACHAPT_009170 [Fusarium lateritium]